MHRTAPSHTLGVQMVYISAYGKIFRTSSTLRPHVADRVFNADFNGTTPRVELDRMWDLEGFENWDVDAGLCNWYY